VKIEWIILAEGLGTASNGAVTAIGVNQNMIAIPSLPATTKRAVMAHVTADDGTLAGFELGVSITVLGPSGQALVTQTGIAKGGTPLWPDLPVSVDIFTEFHVPLQEYGTHVVQVRISALDGDEEMGDVNFYVFAPQ
jgi:hypothetical protein